MGKAWQIIALFCAAVCFMGGGAGFADAFVEWRDAARPIVMLYLDTRNLVLSLVSIVNLPGWIGDYAVIGAGFLISIFVMTVGRWEKLDAYSGRFEQAKRTRKSILRYLLKLFIIFVLSYIYLTRIIKSKDYDGFLDDRPWPDIEGDRIIVSNMENTMIRVLALCISLFAMLLISIDLNSTFF